RTTTSDQMGCPSHLGSSGRAEHFISHIGMCASVRCSSTIIERSSLTPTVQAPCPPHRSCRRRTPRAGLKTARPVPNFIEGQDNVFTAGKGGKPFFEEEKRCRT